MTGFGNGLCSASRTPPLDPSAQVVDGFGRPVRDVGSVPRDDLRNPVGDGAAKAADPEGQVAVGEVARDLVVPVGGELRAGVVVGLSDGLRRVPRQPHLVSRAAGAEQSHQAVVFILAEPFRGNHLLAPGAVERIVLAAAMTEGLILHSAPAPAERGVGELDDVEWSASWTAVGSIVSNTARYGAGGSIVAHSISVRHSSLRSVIQRHGSMLSRPATTSRR